MWYRWTYIALDNNTNNLLLTYNKNGEKFNVYLECLLSYKQCLYTTSVYS